MPSIAAAAKGVAGFLGFYLSPLLLNIKKVQFVPVATLKQFKNSNL